jgi:hypothetical protein
MVAEMKYQCTRKIGEKGEKHDYHADLNVLKKEVEVSITSWRLSSSVTAFASNAERTILALGLQNGKLICIYMYT